MGLATDLAADVASIFKSQWTKRDGQVVPEQKDLKLANDGVLLDGTVLYADINGSTLMVDKLSAELSAEIYKAYLHCAARLIRSENGDITAYDGDRVMAVFIGDNKNTRAVRCGMKIQAAVVNIINPTMKSVYKTDFVLRQVVGVDTSKLLVARTGVRGANDLVWVGPAANHAAKLSAINEPPYATYISKAVYDIMLANVKTSGSQSMWEARTFNGKSIYRTSWNWKIPN
jgi:class 3 adenylate cyclase